MEKNITLIDVIRKARPLVASPKTWTTGYTAKDSRGNYVTTCDPKAVRYCAVGALTKAAFELVGAGWRAHDLANRAACMVSYDLTSINDFKGRKAVLALFDKALAR